MKEYRIKALKAILDKIEKLPISNKIENWDYLLDQACRQILDLPDRPTTHKPYVGWLGQPTSNNLRRLSTMQISSQGIAHIKRWEGFRDKAYLCPANVWTIGYGHTSTAVQGQCINSAQGEALLKDDLRRFESAVKENVKVDLSQGQYDALVSFSFNVGITAFSRSTLLRELNRKNYNGAANQLLRWVHANGRKLPGLIKRREDERRLFLS